MPRSAARHRAALTAALAVAVLLVAAPALPAEELRGLRGERLRPADLEEGPVLVVVWASWSPRCRQIVDRVNSLVERWGERARVVTVNFQEESDDVRRFLDGQSLRAPVFLDIDGAFSKRHAVTHLPGLVVLVDGRETFNDRLPSDADAAVGRALGEPGFDSALGL